jgi:dihydroorotate dehydrogenase
MNFYNFFKPIAFKLDPEFIHDATLSLASSRPTLSSALLPKVKRSNKYKISGNSMSWSFPVGLAAGLDKNAVALTFFDKLGFGAIEFGTITPIAQIGNPKPRIFRYPKDSNIRNSMGFPNAGKRKILANASAYRGDTTLGANIGKNKLSDGEKVFTDYAELYQEFAPISDYLVINVSSPNTPGLRALQDRDFLEKILEAIKPHHQKVTKPLFIKIAPDINDNQLKDFVDMALKFKLAGVVATNTTIDHRLGPGGLSGKCLKEKSAQVRFKLLELMRGTNLDLIGVGGIDSFAELKEFWDHGGKFIQVYTAFILKGPQLLVDIQKGIDDMLFHSNTSSIQDYFDQLKAK